MLVAIFVFSVKALGANAEVTVKRQGMRLEIAGGRPGDRADLTSINQQKLCSTFALKSTKDATIVAKVSPTDTLEVALRNPDGDIYKRVRVESDAAVSALPRPKGSAIIYQLPIRTYFASDKGRENSGRFQDLSDALLQHYASMGIDYLWLTGVLEHASWENSDKDVVKGDAGSYYAIYDSWDVAPALGTLDDFRDVVERAHRHGLRVMIDLVSNHTARTHRTDVVCKEALDFGRHDQTNQGFDTRNNYYYVQNSLFVPPMYSGNMWGDGIYDADIFAEGVQPERPARMTGNNIQNATPAPSDWYETAKLNYGFNLQNGSSHYDPRNPTWRQMADVARYWLQLGVDGFRVDFAHSVPLDFWRYFTHEVRNVKPDAFLVAEAYENDTYMRLPDFSYQGLLQAGFDSVYNSSLYWRLRDVGAGSQPMREADPSRTPLVRAEILNGGYAMTHYMENHDELRLASRHFTAQLPDTFTRAELGLALTAFSALLPGHVLLHGGQELAEDASLTEPFAGDRGRTSIFGYIFQPQVRAWLQGAMRTVEETLQARYSRLLNLKKHPVFTAPHTTAAPTYASLFAANSRKQESRWVGAYVRCLQDECYLVVTNAHPQQRQRTTVHFTTQDGHDTLGALTLMGARADERRWHFIEVLTRPGYEPRDPNVPGSGVPGWALFRAGNVPSGLYIDDIPPRSTLVFRMEVR